MEFSRRLRAAPLAALLLLVLLPAASLAAPLKRSAYRVQKAACATPRSPRGAACQALRLAPLSIAGRAAGRAPSRTQSRRASAHSSKRTGPVAGSLTPAQLHGAYELPAETGSSAAQTIAVVDAYDDPTVESDLAVYDQQFGLPECTKANGCLREIDQEGRESPLPPTEGGWATEITIDVQMAHAICQNCHVLLVEANSEETADLAAGVNAAVVAGASEISNSYASFAAESELLTEEREVNSSSYEHPGIVITASSGDCGYRDQNNPEHASECTGLPANVGFPAASPEVVAVGGTALSEAPAGWQSTVWGNGGGGCSTIFSAPAWQSSLAGWSQTGCGSERLSADVSAVADPYTGVAVYDSTPEHPGDRETGWLVYGGTSVSSPILAAEYALSGGARGVSYPAQTLYRHIGEGSALYDLTSGSNGSCGGSTACTAATGYDGPSGVGSPLGLAAFAPSSGTPASTAAPGIAGNAAVGQTLHATPGSWTNSPTSTGYQWEDCSSSATDCLPIEGATASAYTVATSDQGSRVVLMETAGNDAGYGAAAFSDATASVPAAAPAPSITGLSPKKGEAGTRVTITGSNFVNVTGVSFGSEPASGVQVLSETELSVQAPAGTGTVLVTVTTQSGPSTERHKSRAKFRYKKPRR